MKKESEKTLERKLGKEIKKIGGWCIKFVPLHISGLPDRICLLPEGRVVFVELKTTGDNTSKIQKLIHRRLLKIGFPVYVIESSPEIDDLINDIKSKYIK